MDLIKNFLDAISAVSGPLSLIAFLAVVVLAIFRSVTSPKKGLEPIANLIKEKTTRAQFNAILNLVIKSCLGFSTLAFVLLLAAYIIINRYTGPPNIAPSFTPVSSSSPTFTISPTLPVPSSTPTVLPSTTQPAQPTITQSPTPSPTVFSLSTSGTTIPASSTIINQANVHSLVEIAFWADPMDGKNIVLKFGALGNLIAAGLDNGDIQLWRVHDGTQMGTFHAHQSQITDLKFSPNLRLLASASMDTSIRMWFLLQDGLEQKAILSMSRLYPIYSLAFFPQTGIYLASGDGNNQIHLWRVANGEHLLVKSMNMVDDDSNLPFYVSSLDFSPDGTLLAAASTNGSLQLWRFRPENSTDLQFLWEKVPHPASAIQSIRFSPVDSNLIATASFDGTIRLWNSNRGTLMKLSYTDDPVQELVFSPDGKILAGSTGKGQVYFWSIPEGEELLVSRPYDRLRNLAVSPDGTLFALSTDTGISIWGFGQ